MIGEGRGRLKRLLHKPFGPHSLQRRKGKEHLWISPEGGAPQAPGSLLADPIAAFGEWTKPQNVLDSPRFTAKTVGAPSALPHRHPGLWVVSVLRAV